MAFISEPNAMVTSGTEEDGFYCATTENFDTVVLDLSLPGRDGLTVLSDLRKGGFTVPVLILTARDSVDDRVDGLDGGADDYLVKPFAHAELLARIRALLRPDNEGAGLGLSIVRSTLDSLGGHIALARSEPGFSDNICPTW